MWTPLKWIQVNITRDDIVGTRARRNKSGVSEERGGELRGGGGELGYAARNSAMVAVWVSGAKSVGVRASEARARASAACPECAGGAMCAAAAGCSCHDGQLPVRGGLVDQRRIHASPLQVARQPLQTHLPRTPAILALVRRPQHRLPQLVHSRTETVSSPHPPPPTPSPLSSTRHVRPVIRCNFMATLLPLNIYCINVILCSTVSAGC